MEEKNKEDYLNELIQSINESKLAKEAMKSKQMQEAAAELKTMYDAYIHQGFTNQEAMQLITAMIMGGQSK